MLQFYIYGVHESVSHNIWICKKFLYIHYELTESGHLVFHERVEVFYRKVPKICFTKIRWIIGT